MADFLSRLAERALGWSEAVRPNLTPLFAAPPVETEPVIAETAAPVRRFAVAAPERILSVRREPRVEPEMAEGEAFRPVAVAGPGEVGAASTPRVPPFARHVHAPRRIAVNAENRSAAPPVPLGPALVPPAGPIEHRAAPAPLLPPRAETGAARGNTALETVRAPDAPVEPIVKVTIGRIDVHAASPVPPRPIRPAPAPAPQLTLDDYLRQRREGRR